MKRLCAWMLCLLMLAASVCQGIFVTKVAAANSPAITGIDVDAYPGGTVNVAFWLENNPGVSSLSASLSAPDGWGVPTYVNGNVFSSMSVEDGYSWTNAKTTEDDVLVTFTFTVPANTPAGDYYVTLTPVSAINGDSQSVSLSTVPVKVTVKSAGDNTSNAKLHLALSTDTARRGDSFTVTISATDYPAAKSLMIAPTYDSSVLEITDKQWVITGTNLQDFNGDRGVLAFADAGNLNGKVAVYTFRVKNGAALGSTSVSFVVTMQNPGKAVASATEIMTIACTHQYNQMSTATNYLASAATCQQAATYYYSCTCGAKGTTTFTYGALLPHNYVENAQAQYRKNAATCAQPAGYYKSCSACGITNTDVFTVGTALAHQYVSHTDAAYLKTPATFTAPAVYYYSCSLCGVTGTDTFAYGTRLFLGDVNDNETVDSDDAVYLLWHVFKPGQYPVTQSCDYNNDGHVDVNDAIYLLWYTFDAAQFPLYPASAPN